NRDRWRASEEVARWRQVLRLGRMFVVRKIFIKRREKQMRSNAKRLVMVAALSIAPVAVFAAPPSTSTQSTTHSTTQHHSSTKASMGDHATAGVVKSVSAT